MYRAYDGARNVPADNAPREREGGDTEGVLCSFYVGRGRGRVYGTCGRRGGVQRCRTGDRAGGRGD